MEKTVGFRGEALTLEEVEKLIKTRQKEFDEASRLIGKWLIYTAQVFEDGKSIGEELDELNDCRAILIAELIAERGY